MGLTETTAFRQSERIFRGGKSLICSILFRTFRCSRKSFACIAQFVLCSSFRGGNGGKCLTCSILPGTRLCSRKSFACVANVVFCRPRRRRRRQ